MRDYAAVSPRFWTGETGRLLRAAGHEAQFVALYLLTCPSANMIGLFYLPLPALAHETGLSLEGASEALRRVCATGFARRDEARDLIWVVEMARFQVAESLAATDNRVKGVNRELQPFLKSELYAGFLKRYGAAFHLQAEPLRSPFEAPPEPLRSQEQEQEQEQELPFCSSPESAVGARPLAPASGAPTKKRDGPTLKEVEAEFALWWEEYPSKVGRKPALESWRRLAKAGRLPAAPEMLERLRLHKATPRWVEGTIPNPATYLNQERWSDAPEGLTAVRSNGQGRDQPPALPFPTSAALTPYELAYDARLLAIKAKKESSLGPQIDAAEERGDAQGLRQMIRTLKAEAAC